LEQKATTLEWLYRKGLLTSNEFIAGEALALLIEWRLTLPYPPDSTVYFAARHQSLAPPEQVPLELVLEDIARGTKMSGEDETTMGASIEHVHLGQEYFESVSDRFDRNIWGGDELERIDRLFDSKQTLPMLATAVLDRIGVRELPHTDVPKICTALYTLKEYWREKLIMALMDDVISNITKQLKSQSPTPEGIVYAGRIESARYQGARAVSCSS
jgi:hypothetical protein